MHHPNDQLARGIRRAADLLIERQLSDQTRAAALGKVTELIDTLEHGAHRPLSSRVEHFISQMRTDSIGGEIEDGGSAFGFAESPYSGAANALAPSHVEYQRVGETVEATVLLGMAMEGRPGRAHGGATAAIFDDVMGAVQGVIGRHGYTRTLTISYFAPVPIDEAVCFIAAFAGSEDRRFFIDATATLDGKTLATAHGVFTEVSIDTFGKHEA